MLKEDFVPVAIDQWYERRQKDAKGEFYRKIAGQGPRNDFRHTTQGHYVCDATGKLFGFNGNHIDPNRVKEIMRKAIKEFDPDSYKGVKAIGEGTLESTYNIKPPADGVIVRVYSKILGGYDKPKTPYEEAFQKSIGQDNFWIQADEKKELIKAAIEGGDVPITITQRIARFHLIDNTRGEPPRWTAKEIKSLDLKVNNGIINGSVKLATEDGKLGYEANLYGHFETDSSEVTRFDLVAEGEFWGDGPHTGSGPKGKFPLAVTFRVVDGSEAKHQAVPHGAKGWVDGYFQSVGE